MPGRELYPFGLTRAGMEQYVAAHPEEKAAIYSPWTVVRSAPLDLDPKLSQPVVSGVPAKLYTYQVPRGLCGVGEADGGGPARGGEAESGCGVCALFESAGGCAVVG